MTARWMRPKLDKMARDRKTAMAEYRPPASVTTAELPLLLQAWQNGAQFKRTELVAMLVAWREHNTIAAFDAKRVKYLPPGKAAGLARSRRSSGAVDYVSITPGKAERCVPMVRGVM